MAGSSPPVWLWLRPRLWLRLRPSRTPCGFTLLEILVVVAVLGIMLTLLVPPRSRPVSVTQSAAELAGALRQTRTHALRSGNTAELVLDLARRTYHIDHQPQRFLPDALEITIETASVAVPVRDRAVFRFAADGSTDGGLIRLRLSAGHAPAQATLHIGWFDGQVTIDAEP